MTPETQRIAIAGACGWRVEETHIRNGWKLTNGAKFQTFWWAEGRTPTIEDQVSALPDYLSDLNAMHEAEKTFMNVEVAAQYSRQLIAVFARLHPSAKFVERFYWHATAAQRAEAFLRTLGKWEDAK